MLPTSLVSLGVFDGTGGSVETTMMICVKECPTDLFMAYTSTPMSDNGDDTTTTRMSKSPLTTTLNYTTPGYVALLGGT